MPHTGDTSEKARAFFTRYPLRRFDPRNIMIHASETPSGVFYITEGLVSQYDVTNSGNEVVVNVFKPGAFFPMSWAIHHTPNRYFFEATTPVTTHITPAADAVQFLKDNPDVTFDLLSRVYRGTDGLLRRMTHLMGGDARSRLLFELLNAAHRFGQRQQDGSIFIGLSESNLAKRAGLARETVNRSMQQIKETGLVTVTHGGIVVTRTDELEKLLDAAL